MQSRIMMNIHLFAKILEKFTKLLAADRSTQLCKNFLSVLKMEKFSVYWDQMEQDKQPLFLW